MKKKIESKQGYIQVPGGRVWYKRVGKSSGTPLIILHGGPGYPHDYLLPFEDLSDEREVIFYDQLGCGRSDRPKDKSLWTVERFVEELATIVATLQLKKYHILGHSWGAALGTSFALTKPRGLESLTLVSGYLSTPVWMKDAKRLMKQLPVATQAILKKHEKEGTATSQEFQKAAKAYYKLFITRMDKNMPSFTKFRKGKNEIIYTTMWGPKEFSATGTLKNFDLTPRLTEVTLPVLLICGRYDEATPKVNEYFKRLFPHAQLHVFEDSAHYPFWNEREACMQTILEFLSF